MFCMRMKKFRKIATQRIHQQFHNKHPSLRSSHSSGRKRAAWLSLILHAQLVCARGVGESSTNPLYQKALPTPYRKLFHFANGASTEDQVPVWRIPIFLKGYRGEVFSAEVPSGHTPLLLSISSMAALDMVIHVKDQKVFVNSVNIEMTLFTTKTRHLAIWVAYDPQVGIYDALNPEKEQPKIISEREDLMVYYQEEGGYQVLEGMAFKEVEDFGRRSPAKKPSLGERGVRTTDKRSEISLRREAELSEAASHVQQQDKRMWSALQRGFTMAEQWATNGFQSTVVFEPFAGSFRLTQTASSVFGWTNSQPMDLLDGYDLLTGLQHFGAARPLPDSRGL